VASLDRLRKIKKGVCCGQFGNRDRSRVEHEYLVLVRAPNSSSAQDIGQLTRMSAAHIAAKSIVWQGSTAEVKNAPALVATRGHATVTLASGLRANEVR